MNNLMLLLAFSSIIWYCVDRFKAAWANLKYGKYITTTVAGALGAAAVFGYGLDLICAIGITPEATIIG